TPQSQARSPCCMESTANTTPVVTYDIRYCSSDMIEDGVNGFLIEKGEIGTLSERIMHMLKNPQETKTLGNEAGRTMQTKFSRENYQNLWFSLADKPLEKEERSNSNE